MKKFEFYQINFLKVLLLITVLILIVFGIPLLIWGLDGVTDFLNSFHSTKLIGLFIGALVLLPVIFLKRFMGDKTTLLVSNRMLQVQNKNKLLKEISLSEIDTLVYSDLSTKTLDIILKNGSNFYHIRPNAMNRNKQIEDIQKIINFFTPELKFSTKEETKKKGMGNYKSIEYRVVN